MKKSLSNKIIWIYLLVYFITNIFFLDKFPFMHSDETWLSGLSRTFMVQGIGSTEPFFDLLPRYPHAIKTLFHLMQTIFINIFSYNLFSVRLISLLFGVLGLFFFYKIIEKLLDWKSAIAFTIVLSIDIQFVYASHFARQEIVLVAGLLGCLFYIFSNIEKWTIKNDVLLGVFIGLLIGVHPNSFFVALACGSVYLYYILFEHNLKTKNLIALISVVGLFGMIFVAMSFSFNVNFIKDYSSFGSGLGVTNSFYYKIQSFFPYYAKLFRQVSGTYYIPNIKLQLIIFVVTIFVGLLMSFKHRKFLKILFPIIAINIGFVIVGRYAQPSVIFIFPLCYLMFAYLFALAKNKYKLIGCYIVGCILFLNSILSISPYINNDYEDYLDNINQSVPENSKVLSNLNSEYAFDNYMLLDYRNLEYLDEADLSFEDYVRERDIEYIIYPEEMDFIYKMRPVWNVVYGNIFPYYEEINIFFREECTLIDEFSSPYAMRIVRYVNDKKWTVKVYKVNVDE